MIAGAILPQMAATRRAIWLRIEAPSGLGTGRGLARFDRATRRFTRVTAGSSWLPDSDVVAIAASGDSLFVAMREALAVHDGASGRAEVRWFHATPVAAPVAEARPRLAAAAERQL